MLFRLLGPPLLMVCEETFLFLAGGVVLFFWLIYMAISLKPESGTPSEVDLSSSLQVALRMI